MLHAARILVLRVLLQAVAVALFVVALGWVHDYPQTKQAISNYNSGDDLLWKVTFFFINEAGSGIKYELTGDERHLGHYPRMDFDRSGREARRVFETALFAARMGDWEEQLRVGHLYALGWGVEKDLDATLRWYLASERTANDAGEAGKWEGSFRRQSVSSFISDELRAMSGVIGPPPWREANERLTDTIVIEGSRG